MRDISPAVYDLSLAQQVRTSMPRHQSNSQVVMKNESTLISYYMIDCIGYIYKTRKIVIPLIIGIYIKILNTPPRQGSSPRVTVTVDIRIVSHLAKK